MNCPVCGSQVELYGLPAGIYPPSFKCYTCSPYGAAFQSRETEAYAACDAAKSMSASNAKASP